MAELYRGSDSLLQPSYILDTQLSSDYGHIINLLIPTKRAPRRRDTPQTDYELWNM